MENMIRTISEAYSIQPSHFSVGQTIGYPKEEVIDRIVQEDVFIEGDPFAYYVGYSKDGKRLFEFRKGTVNVMYV